MDKLINELVKSPRLKVVTDKLLMVLKEESKKRQEFYDSITEDDKAEFINGEVLMHSPVKKIHSDVLSKLNNLLYNFVHLKNQGEVYVEKIMIELTRNSYEPDIVFFKNEKALHFHNNQMLFPAPDFIVEIISPSTEQNDRGIKMEDYAFHGVEEYWIIDPEHQVVEQYLLKNERYELEFKGKNGFITSKVIEGFTINTQAIFHKKENLQALQKLMEGD